MIIISMVVLVMLSIAGLYIWNGRVRAAQEASEFPYVKRRYLCNRDERNFFRYLVKAVSRDYMILTKVRDGFNCRREWSQRKKVVVWKNSHVTSGFCVVDRATTEVAAVIELFDDRGSNVKQVQQVPFLDKLFSRFWYPNPFSY